MFCPKAFLAHYGDFAALQVRKYLLSNRCVRVLALLLVGERPDRPSLDTPTSCNTSQINGAHRHLRQAFYLPPQLPSFIKDDLPSILWKTLIVTQYRELSSTIYREADYLSVFATKTLSGCKMTESAKAGEQRTIHSSEVDDSAVIDTTNAIEPVAVRFSGAPVKSISLTFCSRPIRLLVVS